MPSLSKFNKANVSTSLLLNSMKINSTSLTYIEHLFNSGANINAYDNNGNCSLHVFVSEGRLDIVKYYIDVGANLTLTNSNNYTAVDLALQNKDFKMSRAIRSALLGKKEEDLLEAVSVNNLDKVIEIDKQGANLNACAETGVTSLHLAALNGFVDIANYLIEREVNLNAVDENNVSAIHYALQNDSKNHQNILHNLIKSGANPAIGVIEDFSALYKAVHRGYYEEVKLILLEGVDVNIMFPEYNSTPLHAAVMNQNSEMVHLLLSRGADVTIKDYLGNLAIDYAKEQGSKYIAMILGASIVKFISAAANGKVSLMDLLLKEGADINSLVKSKKYYFNALEIAAEKCEIESVEYLMDQGVTYQNDFFGEGALYKAARSKCYKALDAIIKHGIDAEANNWLGFSALDLVPEYKYVGDLAVETEGTIVVI